jgi:hypothetical protein
MKLLLENPLSSDHIRLRWSLNKNPGVVGMESSALFFHGPALVGVGHSIPVGAGNWRECLRMECCARLLIPGFASSCHAV